MKILIVDDEESSRLYLEIILTFQGYDIDTATNGKEALALVRRHCPALVIADVVMPEMDGFELCREMKGDSEFSGIPFIFISGNYTSKGDKGRALLLGAARYLFKPIEPEPLFNAVREVMAEYPELM